MRMLRENFEAALRNAIYFQTTFGSADTAYVQGLREVLEASENKESIWIEET